MKMCMKLGKQR